MNEADNKLNPPKTSIGYFDLPPAYLVDQNMAVLNRHYRAVQSVLNNTASPELREQVASGLWIPTLDVDPITGQYNGIKDEFLAYKDIDNATKLEIARSEWAGHQFTDDVSDFEPADFTPDPNYKHQKPTLYATWDEHTQKAYDEIEPEIRSKQADDYFTRAFNKQSVYYRHFADLGFWNDAGIAILSYVTDISEMAAYIATNIALGAAVSSPVPILGSTLGGAIGAIEGAATAIRAKHIFNMLHRIGTTTQKAYKASKGAQAATQLAKVSAYAGAQEYIVANWRNLRNPVFRTDDDVAEESIAAMYFGAGIAGAGKAMGYAWRRAFPKVKPKVDPQVQQTTTARAAVQQAIDATVVDDMEAHGATEEAKAYQQEATKKTAETLEGVGITKEDLPKQSIDELTNKEAKFTTTVDQAERMVRTEMGDVPQSKVYYGEQARPPDSRGVVGQAVAKVGELVNASGVKKQLAPVSTLFTGLKNILNGSNIFEDHLIRLVSDASSGTNNALPADLLKEMLNNRILVNETKALYRTGHAVLREYFGLGQDRLGRSIHLGSRIVSPAKNEQALARIKEKLYDARVQGKLDQLTGNEKNYLQAIDNMLKKSLGIMQEYGVKSAENIAHDVTYLPRVLDPNKTYRLMSYLKERYDLNYNEATELLIDLFSRAIRKEIEDRGLGSYKITEESLLNEAKGATLQEVKQAVKEAKRSLAESQQELAKVERQIKTILKKQYKAKEAIKAGKLSADEPTVYLLGEELLEKRYEVEQLAHEVELNEVALTEATEALDAAQAAYEQLDALDIELLARRYVLAATGTDVKNITTLDRYFHEKGGIKSLAMAKGTDPTKLAHLLDPDRLVFLEKLTSLEREEMNQFIETSKLKLERVMSSGKYTNLNRRIPMDIYHGHHAVPNLAPHMIMQKDLQLLATSYAERAAGSAALARTFEGTGVSVTTPDEWAEFTKMIEQSMIQQSFNPTTVDQVLGNLNYFYKRMMGASVVDGSIDNRWLRTIRNGAYTGLLGSSGIMSVPTLFYTIGLHIARNLTVSLPILKDLLFSDAEQLFRELEEYGAAAVDPYFSAVTHRIEMEADIHPNLVKLSLLDRALLSTEKWAKVTQRASFQRWTDMTSRRIATVMAANNIVNSVLSGEGLRAGLNRFGEVKIKWGNTALADRMENYIRKYAKVKKGMTGKGYKRIESVGFEHWKKPDGSLDKEAIDAFNGTVLDISMRAHNALLIGHEIPVFKRNQFFQLVSQFKSIIIHSIERQLKYQFQPFTYNPLGTRGDSVRAAVAFSSLMLGGMLAKMATDYRHSLALPEEDREKYLHDRAFLSEGLFSIKFAKEMLEAASMTDSLSILSLTGVTPRSYGGVANFFTPAAVSAPAGALQVLESYITDYDEPYYSRKQTFSKMNQLAKLMPILGNFYLTGIVTSSIANKMSKPLEDIEQSTVDDPKLREYILRQEQHNKQLQREKINRGDSDIDFINKVIQ